MGKLYHFEEAEKLEYDLLWRSSWFLRTKDQSEIDYIIEGGDEQIHA
ncbi:hypothetical protein [Dysgonomonas mossii]